MCVVCSNWVPHTCRFFFVYHTTNFVSASIWAEMAIFALKQTVDFYYNQDTSIYMCFLDEKNVFYRLNHWIQAKKLLNRNVLCILWNCSLPRACHECRLSRWLYVNKNNSGGKMKLATCCSGSSHLHLWRQKSNCSSHINHPIFGCARCRHSNQNFLRKHSVSYSDTFKRLIQTPDTLARVWYLRWTQLTIAMRCCCLWVE